MKNLAANTVAGSFRECTAAGISHGLNEAKVHKKSKMELKNPPSTEAMNKTDKVTPHESRGRIKFKIDTENNEHLHKLKDGVCSAKYQPLFNENNSELTRESKKKRDLPEEKKKKVTATGLANGPPATNRLKTKKHPASLCLPTRMTM